MAAQTTYQRLTDVSLPGKLAFLSRKRDVIARACEDATMEYGIAVGLGTDPDKQCLAGSTGGPAFAIAMREDSKQGEINTADIFYSEFDQVNMLREGYVYATCPSGCTAGDPVKYNDTTGVVDAGTPTLTGAATAGGGNTGNGTSSAVTVGTDAQVGNYILTCIDASVAGSEIFSVVAPDGTRLADLVVGVAYLNDSIGLTLTAGGTNFVVGDTWTVAVANATGETLLPGAAWDIDTAVAGLGIIRLDGTAPTA